MANEKRLIDANDAIERLKASDQIVRSSIWETDEVVELLEDCPTVDAAEVVHGRWESNRWEYVCSCCRTPFTDELPWITHPDCRMPNCCPNCGARMDGEK